MARGPGLHQMSVRSHIPDRAGNKARVTPFVSLSGGGLISPVQKPSLGAKSGGRLENILFLWYYRNTNLQTSNNERGRFP